MNWDKFKEIIGWYNICRPRIVERINIQFYTEYNLYKSIIGHDNYTYEEIPNNRDIPDLLILITNPVKILYVIEVKTYNRPDKEKLKSQMDNQAKIINYLKEKLETNKVYHFALLPERLVEEYNNANF